MEAVVIGRIDFEKSVGVSLHLWKVPMGPGMGKEANGTGDDSTWGNLSSVLLCCVTRTVSSVVSRTLCMGGWRIPSPSAHSSLPLLTFPSSLGNPHLPGFGGRFAGS